MQDAKTKNEVAKQVAETLPRYFTEYERKHFHLEPNSKGQSLFMSMVADFLEFQAEGRCQVPMGYYKRKRREFPGPREAFKTLAVAPDVMKIIRKSLFGEDHQY